MRILIAPDGFTGTMSAEQACAAIAQGWLRTHPTSEVTCLPLADGGPGFLEAISLTPETRIRELSVPGPYPDAPDLLVRIALRPSPQRDGGVPTGGITAYLESAHVIGLDLIPPQVRDPRVTTTVGLGMVLHSLVTSEPELTRIVIGVGGTGTNDAGMGALHALATAAGFQLPARMAEGGSALRGLQASDLAELEGLQRWWHQQGVQLEIATDVTSPLVGMKGASKVFAQQKGASAAQAQELDIALSDAALACVSVLGFPQSLAVEPGSGAGGGVGFGLMLLGATRTSGLGAVAAAVDLDRHLADHDLVLTGEGCLDWQSLAGKVVVGLAEFAQNHGKPVVALVGQCQLESKDLRVAGIDAAYPMAKTVEEIRVAMANPEATLADLAARVARTWGPRG